jgi:hypothetical protein
MGCPLDVIVVDNNSVTLASLTMTSFRSCADSGEVNKANAPINQMSFIDVFPA